MSDDYEYVSCPKCLTSRTGDKAGDPCKTPNCDGVITPVPDFRTLVDRLPEKITCGRRNGGVLVGFRGPEGADYWQRFKSNGDRVCSYCGSLHPDDFFAKVKLAAEAPEDAEYRSVTAVEPSDKSYKIYVHTPGVRNAHEGGIKFYKHHFPRNEDGTLNLPEGAEEEFAEAVRRTRVRFEAYLAKTYGPTGRKDE